MNNTSNNTFDILIVSHNGWWSVICPALEISGFGESEEAATTAFERSFISTMTARFRASFLNPSPAEESTSGPEPVNLGDLRGGQVIRRTRLTLSKAA
jgi:hypothetical protein